MSASGSSPRARSAATSAVSCFAVCHWSVAASNEEHAGKSRRRVRQQFRRNVPANREHTAGADAAADRRAKSHRDTLREPGEDDRLVAGADVVDDVVDVVDVVANRVFTVLAGHPGGHDILRLSTVEAVQALRRDERPLVRPGHAGEAIHLDFRRFLVAVKADEQPFGGADVADQHSAMGGGADGKGSHGCDGTDRILLIKMVQGMIPR